MLESDPPSEIKTLHKSARPPSTRIRSASALLLVALSACSSNTTQVEEPTQTTLSISLSRANVTLIFLGASQSLVATVRDQDGKTVAATVSWTSADATVATVDGVGTVVATGKGTTTITASVGSVSATATVVVNQLPTNLSVVAGGGQRGVAGSTLPDTIVVLVADEGGAPVEGVDVTFAPSATAGSVNVTTARSDASGHVRVVWTLGSAYGPQEVVASVNPFQVSIPAFSWSDTPAADLVFASAVTLSRTTPSTLEPVGLLATVKNQGDLATGAPWRLQVLAGATELFSEERAALDAGEEVSLEFEVGPLPAGTSSLQVVLDPLDAVVELIETNNVAARNVSVVAQTSVNPDGIVSGLSALQGEQLLFRVDVPPGGPRALNIRIGATSQTQDVDLFVEAGERPTNKEGYDDCVSAKTPGSPESCQLVYPEGTYHILLDAFYAFSGVTMTLETGDAVVPFDISLSFVGTVPASVQNAASAAASRWEELIIGDVTDVTIGSPENIDACVEGETVSGTIDDIQIFVQVTSFTSPTTLASAGPCAYRTFGELPAWGVLKVNQDKISQLEAEGGLVDVMIHEMGHVLGLGTMWEQKDLLRNPSIGNPGADTHFIGARARAAFDAAGGTSYVGAKVPVENSTGNEGSDDGHWRESVFRTELMSPSYESGAVKPVSAITVESFRDLGYGVDVSAADAYTLPAAALAAAPAVTPAGPGLIGFRGDVRRGPVVFVGKDGKTGRVRW
jgi:hypothetical protein